MYTDFEHIMRCSASSNNEAATADVAAAIKLSLHIFETDWIEWTVNIFPVLPDLSKSMPDRRKIDG